MRKLFLLAALLTVVAAVWAQESYFEAPRLFTAPNTRFPQLVSSNGLGVAAFQRIGDPRSGSGTIDVLVQASDGGLTWSDPVVVARGIRYEGTAVPPVYSIAMSRSGDVMLATVDYERVSAESGTSIIRVFLSTDGAATFRQIHTVSGDISLVSPQVFPAADGGWFLTMERFDEPSNRIVYTHTADGVTWTELLAIPADVLQTGTQSDAEHFAVGRRDVLLFVGENFAPPAVQPGEPEIPDTPQIYAIHSDDSGRTWSATDPATGDSIPGLPGVSLARITDPAAFALELAESGLVIPHTYMRILDEGVPSVGALAYQDLVMRRPAVAARGDQRLLAFEAGLRLETDTTRQIATTSLDRDGNASTPVRILTASSLRRGEARVPYNQPEPVLLPDAAYVIAYQDPGRGGLAVLYERVEDRWRDRTPATSMGVATYPTAAVIGAHPHFFWHRRARNDADLPTQIVYLEPDQRADPPIVRGESFQLGRRSASSTAAFTWTAPADASGIVGYAWTWTRDPDAEVPVPQVPSTEQRASFTADEDGEWYLRIRSLDRAGNWSAAATAEFYRDTTPPGRVSFLPPRLDEDGYLASNTFTLAWEPPEDDVIGGYFTDLVFVADADAEIDPRELPVIEPPRRAPIEQPAVSRDNYDNGLWALAVTPVDSVGNIGESSVLYVRMNKYVPVTEIYTIAAIPDPLDRYNLSILGRGFTANGVIYRVIIDRDRQPPYDYVYDRSSPGYRIFSDRNMAGPLLDNLETGEYFVGLSHTERGTRFSARTLTIERNGTVKFGDYTVVTGRPFAVADRGLRIMDGTTAIVWVVIALMFAVVILSSTRLVVIAREGVQLRLEARALVASKPGLLAQREQRIAEMKRRGIGLRTKFAFFVVVVVMAVVGMVAVGLGTATLNSQRLVLLRGLKDRVDVLMESMVTSAEEPLQDPDTSTLDLDALPASVQAMDEALYATVTGPKSRIQTSELPDSLNYVWGTNDPVLQDEDLDSRAAGGLARQAIPPGEALDLGRTRLDDAVSGKIEVLGELIDLVARSRLNTIVKERELTFAISNELRQQINAVALDGGDTTELEQRRQQAQLTLSALNAQITSGVEQVTLDSLALIRWAEYRAQQRVEPGEDGANDEQTRRDAIASAVYEIPDSVTEIEADIAAARAGLNQAGGYASLLDDRVKSYPIFEPGRFDRDQRDFLFYQPVVEPDISIFPLDSEAIQQMDEGDLAGLDYFLGTVRLGVATDIIVEQIDLARTDIVRITALIALAALGAGIAGALLLATIVVRPINKLVQGVDHIKNTKFKENLRDYRIELRSRDELFTLADTINTMSFAIAVAAEAEKNLRATSELQKMFIPLETSPVPGGKRRKLTTAHTELPTAEFFGYYEGADALSGDYFTFEELRPEQYAFIKCDVAGHGVRAAFMMVEVATMFQNRIGDWRQMRGQPSLTDLLQDINSLLVVRGFEGMFAAMTIGIVSTASGAVRLAHAGDREQRIYRSATRRIEEHELQQAPATGVIDPEVFGRGPDYREFAFELSAGDIMLLATDGIEESARRYRSAEFDAATGDYRVVRLDADGFDKLKAEVADEAVVERLSYDSNSGDVTEEFSTGRMIGVAEALMARGRFKLERFRPVDANEELVFDYAGLASTAENLVLAVMAAEKVFRISVAPLGVEVEPVRVDSRLNTFLETHFLGYRRLFSHRLADEDRPDYDGSSTESIEREYLYFGGLIEEVQADDLTILTIRKK